MCSIVKRTSILLDRNVCDRDEVIDVLVHQLKREKRLQDENSFKQILIQRELVFPTSIGNQIAIPHGMSDEISKPTICFMRLNEPILWDSEQDERVSMIILIAVPSHCPDIHIKIISQLVKQFMHEEYILRLRTGDCDEVYQMLKKELDIA